MNLEDDILRALRRITRAITLHSRRLSSTFGLTGPQLVCLRAIGEKVETSSTALAKEVSLSQGTITGIVDRLVARQLVERKRSDRDRRVVTVTLTPAGKALVEQAPSPLQERFVDRLAKLTTAEQEQLRATLYQVVEMMGGENIEAAPVLTTATVAQSTEEVMDDLDTGVTDVAIASDIVPDLEDALPSDKTSEPD